MSCCPPAPALVEASSGDSDVVTQDTQIRPGESVECYMKRAENPSGLKDDLTGIVPDKILNTAIPIDANASINVTFKLTPDSTRTPTNWVITGTLPSGVTQSGAANSVLSGTVAEADRSKTFKILVEAVDGTGSIDSRTFTFAAATANGGNSIQFVNPLPAGRVTSIFNPNRVHPVRGTVSPHKGVDMSTPGAATTDVVAAADGIVTFTGNQAGGAGNYIKIDHYDSSGRLLCQTVYMHLAKFYVSTGQKVAAGQKIGLEGNTGIGTAAHLHFECRLIKNGQTTWIDPAPLIRGSVELPLKTDANNQPVTGGPTETTGGAVLTRPDVDAKAGGCEPFGPLYPPDPEAPAPAPVPPPSTDPFDFAWFFTMKYEVGPHWSTAPEYSPGDYDVDNGLKDTTLQRKKTGYKDTIGFPGGTTKFGIAQGPNPSIDVKSIDYMNARNTGFNNYWRRGSNSPESISSSKPKTAVMLFDMYYLHGSGNVSKYILPQANIGALNDVDSCNALNAAQVAFIESIVRANPSRQKYRNGWLNRANALLQYALAMP